MPFVLAPVLPDGEIAFGDKPHIAWMYAGISALAAVGLTLDARSASLTLSTRALGLTLDARSAALTLETR